MVEINLEAIVLADSPKYIEFDVIDILYFANPQTITKMPHGLSRIFFDNLEAQYGILRKYVWGYNTDGQYTQAFITAWDDTYLYVQIWSNQHPKYVSHVKLTLVRSIPYIGATATQVLAVGDNLVEKSLSIKQQFESRRKLDLRVSTASFDLVGSSTIDNFFNNYWSGRHNDYNYAIGVHIKVDGVGKFWGYLKPENIIYDPESRVYSIDAFDWVKFILDTKGQNYLPDYPTPNLSEFLEDNMFVFNELSIDVGTTSQTWIPYDYNYIVELTADGYPETISIQHLMTVEDLIIECIKHYGVYMYYDGDKNLIFKKRELFNIPTDNVIDDDIISQTLSKSYELRDYDSLLINAEWVDEEEDDDGYRGWALIWKEGNIDRSQRVRNDLGDIPVNRKYLDLRQAIPYVGSVYSSGYRLFASRARGDVFNDYIYLLYDTIHYDLEVVRTDLQINDLINFSGSDFIIRNIEILPDENKSVILMEQKIGD